MPLNFDVRRFPDAQREQIAWRIHESPRWKLPQLSAWNYSLCRIHARGWDEEVRDADGVVRTHKVYDRPKPMCRACGVHFRNHQQIGVAWLYFKKHALLGDTMGPQPLDAQVLTPTGFVDLGALQVGDVVVDPTTGGSTTVEEVIPQGVRPVYKVTFTDGSSTRAADTHLWQVNTPDRKHWKRPPFVKTTADLLDRDLDYPNGNHRWYVPVTEPVELRSAPLDLDPYTVGVLLGDGYVGGSVMLSTDHEIIESLVLPEGVEPVLVQEKGVAYSGDYRLNGMKSLLPRDLTLSSAESKSVPRRYLFSSVADRVSLLQGLLDTDGTSAGSATVEWGTVSWNLADDMAFLVQSLGGTFNRSEKIPTFTYKGETRIGQRFYRFHISLPGHISPFRLARKAVRHTPATKYQPTRAIVSIDFIGEQEVRCIRVASESHLYVTDDFIVTHNSGKTTEAAGLLAMLAETGELSLFRDRSDKFGGMGRAILVPRSAALHQWRAELARMLPGLDVLVAEGSKAQRTQLYLQPWLVLLIGPEMLRNDYQMLENFDLSLFLTDDIDQLRNPLTDTSYVLDRMGSRGVEGLRTGTDRYVIMTGTPLQKRLPELHAVLDGIGGSVALGSQDSFIKQHVRYETIDGKQVLVGYRNLETVKRKIAPLVLRRTAADLDDVHLPTIVPNDVMLDLYPAQRAKYNELRAGVLKIIREEGTQVKRPTALAKIHYGAAICAGLAALGEADGPMTSVKMDWIMDQLTEGELSEEKVVIFVNLKNTVRALQDRIRQARIGHVTVWGEVPDKSKRNEAQERFWNDPRCRVLIGTRAIEQSLNLQVSRHLVNVDTILNPARMEQLAGRIRRDGSAYQHVFVHNLLTVRTQEERYPAMLEREAALASHIWEENSQLFNALSPMALLHLISG